MNFDKYLETHGPSLLDLADMLVVIREERISEVFCRWAKREETPGSLADFICGFRIATDIMAIAHIQQSVREELERENQKVL